MSTGFEINGEATHCLKNQQREGKELSLRVSDLGGYCNTFRQIRFGSV